MHPLSTTLLVAAAGSVGVLARWGCIRLVGLLANGLPPHGATLTVNLIGSFLAGILYPLTRSLHPAAISAIFIGFLGAFTTFSTYSLETVRLAFDGCLTQAAVNVLLQNILGLAAAALGLWIGRMLSA